MRKTRNITTLTTAACLLLITAVDVDAQGGRGANPANSLQKTITGVVTNVDPTTRIVTLTPTEGAPVTVLFYYNQGGACKTCTGTGRRIEDPDRVGLFEERVTMGSTWTVTYTRSFPEGAATWFPGGTVNFAYVAKLVSPK